MVLTYVQLPYGSAGTYLSTNSLTCRYTSSIGFVAYFFFEYDLFSLKIQLAFYGEINLSILGEAQLGGAMGLDVLSNKAWYEQAPASRGLRAFAPPAPHSVAQYPSCIGSKQ